MKVSKKLFALYLGVSYKTACKDYEFYLSLLPVKKEFLTVSDICKIDGLTFDQFFSIVKFKPAA